MLVDINGSFYEYVRGGLLVLSAYHLLIYIQNRNKLYIYYSFYFISVFTFFFSQSVQHEVARKIFWILVPAIHSIAYVFYLSFTRTLLDTKNTIPKWDVYLKIVRNGILFFIIPVLTLTAVFLGYTALMYVFFTLAGFINIFSIITYIKFYSINTMVAKYCVCGSLLYFVFANITFVFNIFYTIDEFIEAFGIHLTFFTYIAAILDAFVFALLIGYRIRILENDQVKSLKQIEKLKRIVIKDYIILKDKSKVYIKDLIYIKSEDHYLNVFINDGNNHFVRGKLSAIIKELPPNFIQCHRSYIVNSNVIKRIKSTSLVLENKHEIPLSKTFKDQI